MTINFYRTAQAARVLALSTKEAAEKQTLISDIARAAIVKAEHLEPEEVSIDMDSSGNVLVEGQKSPINAATAEKKVIWVAAAEAYQRINEAAQKRIALLERLYEQSHHDATYWFKRSFLMAMVESVILTFSTLISFILCTHNLNALLLPAEVMIVLINILNVLIIIWVFRQSKHANTYVDLYLSNLTEIRSFATVSQFVSQLDIDHTYKHLLQKTLLSQALGIQKKSSTKTTSTKTTNE